MARFILFLILLVPLTIAGNWLLSHPGSITIDWLDYTIELHTALAAGLLLTAYAVALLLALALWQLVTWPERRRARRRYRTLAKGLQHITQGMTALAIGDANQAEAALKKARATLPGEPLPQLLTAQLLQHQGKQEAARTQFRALLSHPATAQLATHRLIEQHMTRGEWAEAAALAEDARKDAPKDRWMALTLIDLYTRMGESSQILKLTEGWHWQSPLNREERHRYAAVGYLMEAQREDATLRHKLNALRHAHGYAPTFLPAAIAYSDALVAEGDYRKARKILATAWDAQPSVLLIGPIIRAVADAKPRQQLRLVRSFRGTSAAAHLLQAQFALDTRDYANAIAHAEASLAVEESKQACSIMAEAQKQLNGAEASTVWMARAMDAPAAASWICQRCGSVHTQWEAHCHSCQAFDSLVYERPESRITTVELAVKS